MFVGVATTALADKLATLGTSPLLAGEAKAVQRGKKIALKPDANVRLLALYGVGDQSTSLRTWVSKAPAWCETRLLELPGHGYRADESLPPCAARRDAPVPPSALEEQRAAWVASPGVLLKTHLARWPRPEIIEPPCVRASPIYDDYDEPRHHGAAGEALP